MAGVIINGQEPIVRDLSTGLTTTLKVNPAISPDIETATSTSMAQIRRRYAEATALLGPGQVMNGVMTKRAKIETGKYEYGILYGYFTSATGAPGVSCKWYHVGDDTLQADDSALHADWQEEKFPQYLLDDPTLFNGVVSDATDPSAVFAGAAAVTGTQYRMYGYELGVGGTAVSAGIEDTGGTDLIVQYPFAINGGTTRSLWPLYVQPAVSLGLRIDKSAAQTVAGSIIARRSPLIITANTEFAILVGAVVNGTILRHKGFAVELVGTGTAGTDQITAHLRYVGFF